MIFVPTFDYFTLEINSSSSSIPNFPNMKSTLCVF
jgi:hypothetical protein